MIPHIWNHFENMFSCEKIGEKMPEISEKGVRKLGKMETSSFALKPVPIMYLVGVGKCIASSNSLKKGIS